MKFHSCHFFIMLSPRKILRCFVLALLIVSTVGLVRAEVLFDSTSNSVFDTDAVTKGVILNASFSTKENPIILQKVSILLRRSNNENGLIRLNLLSDNRATPGALLEMLAEVDSRDLPIGDQLLTIPIKIQKPLNAKTRYWIQISATASSGAIAYSRKHNGYGVKSEYYLNMYGLHRNDETGPYIFKIEGYPQRH